MKNTETTPDFNLKIRHYVFSLLRRNDNVSVQLPSSYKLAEMFGTTRRIARYALERMVEEGVLITRRRGGTFTNPRYEWGFHGKEKIPLIGLRIANGDLFYYGPPLLQLLSVLTGTLGRVGYNARILSDSAPTPDEFDTMLKYSNVDALVTVFVESKLVERAAQRLPVVNVGFPCKSVGGVYYYGNEITEKLLHLFQKQEKLEIWWLSSYENMANLKQYWRENPAIELAEFEIPSLGEPDWEKFESKLRKQIPDCLFMDPKYQNSIQELLLKQDVPRDRCTLIFTNQIFSQPEYPAYFVGCNLEKSMELVVDELGRIFSGQPRSGIMPVSLRLLEPNTQKP